VEIVKDFESRAMQSGSEDPEVSFTLAKCEEYMPGEVDTHGNGISCKIQHHKLWRRVLKTRYPDAIIGKQRRNSISTLKAGMDKAKGIRFIIRFKLKGTEDTFLKANLAIYDNDVLIVTGTSYFLWVMDNLKEMTAEVQKLWDDVQKKIADEQAEEDEEECPEEESNQDTLETSDSRCCELEYRKLSDRVADIDTKIGVVGEKLNLVLDTHKKMNELQTHHRVFSSIESKLDQILQRLDSPTVSAQSEGAQTYLVGADRFEELKDWFKEFCLKELK